MPVIVEITPDRRMFASIPIEFDAPKYAITGWRRSADGRDAWRVVFTAGVALCKNSPGAGCLERPVFHPILGYPQLEPGFYEFLAIVKDQTGVRERKYTLTFRVK